MHGSIASDPTGGSVIRTYYLADLALRFGVVTYGYFFWRVTESRVGLGELLFIAIVIAAVIGANQLYKSGYREFLTDALAMRPLRPLYGRPS